MKSKTQFALRRIFFLQIVFLIFGLAVGIRLFWLQILNHTHYQVLAEAQHSITREIFPSRGKILASDGSFLVTNQESFLLYLVPSQVENEEVIKTLFSVLIEEKVMEDNRDLEEEKDQVKSKLKDRGLFWLPVAHKVPSLVRKRIEELNLAGVYFEPENERIYPEGDLAAHVLGFVGADSEGKPQGYFGIEGFYNGDLSGTPGLVFSEKDVRGEPIPLGSYTLRAARTGRDLVLTISRELQYMLEKKLREGVKKYGAKSGTVILVKPQTGEILAMANYPTFSPQLWLDSGDFTNLAVSENYEPGSILKPVLMAAALESRVVSPEDKYECTGPFLVQGHKIKTWNDKYHGLETMTQILQHSCNPGAAWLSQKLGFEAYWKFLKKFGLGQKMGVDLQGESVGVVKEKSTWREIDLATAAFGQGIAVTPLQLIMVYSTIANDGVRMKPFMVKEIRRGDFNIQTQPEVVERVVSSETAQKLKAMLKSVVEKGEFHWFVEHEGLDKFLLAGKTGTAQKPERGGYSPYKTQVTFVGFVPVDQPEFVLLVKMDSPTASTYSAETAVPLWLEMAKDLIIFFGISPKR